MFAATKNFSLPVRARAPRPSAAARPATAAIDLAELSRRVGAGLHLDEPELCAAGALLDGRFSLARLRDGLFLHCTSVLHRHDMTSRFPMLEEGVKVLLKLEGNARVRLGGVALPLDAGQGAASTPCGAVVTLCQPEDFERRCRAGTRERMVVVTLTYDWFAAAGLDPEPFRPHLAVRPWQPSARAICLAEQLINPTAADGPMLGLYQESRALELVAEAFAGLGLAEAPPASDLRPGEFQRVCRLREWLDSGAADHASMAEIALHIGCNANTLQRQFRQAFGSTIFEHLRSNRLKRAADAIERHGVSIGRAAEIAGYSSQANFATAFRRQFGLTPKQLRGQR